MKLPQWVVIVRHLCTMEQMSSELGSEHFHVSLDVLISINGCQSTEWHLKAYEPRP